MTGAVLKAEFAGALLLAVLHLLGLDERAPTGLLVPPRFGAVVAPAVKAAPALLLARVSGDAMTAAALVLSAAGDVALAVDDAKPRDEAFVVGLGSFLLAHVAFAAGIVRGGSRWQSAPKQSLVSHLTAIPYSALGAVIGSLIVAHATPALRVPVIVYCAAISLMATCALRRHVLASPLDVPSARLAHAGAFSFVVSDSILGVHKFVPASSAPLPFSRGDAPARRLFVMVPYYAALFLLCHSSRARIKPRRST